MGSVRTVLGSKKKPGAPAATKLKRTSESGPSLAQKVALRRENTPAAALDWESLTSDQQQELLSNTEILRKVYRKFHRSMLVGGSQIPQDFKDRYLDCMQRKGTKGCTTGKHLDSSQLCKLWVRMVRLGGDDERTVD